MPLRLIVILMVLNVLIVGCSATTYKDSRDPLEGWNRTVYKFNHTLDSSIIKPAAKAYGVVTPEPVQNCVRNFFSNLGDVGVTLNDILQGKLKQACSDVTRLAINSTVGVLGLFDVAKHVGLEKHNEDFGQTLGVWGIKGGLYIVWPFLGPSTARDSLGLTVDYNLDLVAKQKNISTRNQSILLRETQNRHDWLSQEQLLEDPILDEYQLIREYYLQRRQFLTHGEIEVTESLDE